MLLNRRRLIFASLASTVGAGIAHGATEPVIRDAEDRPVPTFRLPVEITGQFVRAPGALIQGGANPDVFVTEFFDFNCPYCRKAARELDQILQDDPDIRLVLMHNAILSPGSVEAAKVALAAYSLKGMATAYSFYLKLLAAPGAMNGARALDIAEASGFEREDIAGRAGDARIAAALEKHMQLAASAGFGVTPSFEIQGVGLLGYPGVAAMRKAIASVRSCDQLACE